MRLGDLSSGEQPPVDEGGCVHRGDMLPSEGPQSFEPDLAAEDTSEKKMVKVLRLL